MPRLVRRKPLFERLTTLLNPLDFLLWLSEEFETRDWDTKNFANPVGLGLNFVFLIARSNSGPSGKSYKDDDVFGDATRGSGWFKWFAAFLVHIMTCLCLLNATYTFLRKRHYRLFEVSVDAAPSTPSAQRVRVDSSPVSSSPLRFLTKIISDTSAQSRAHPDPTRDVWELAVWDPLPVCLRLFCLFSPGHVLVYWLFLPVLSADPWPSITVAKTIFLEVLLSVQLLILQSNFSQQTKDTAVIHKEVLNEYDTKYVHPLLRPVMRDVGTQFSGPDEKQDEVITYTPTTVLRRVFKTNPNPNYAKFLDPDDTGSIPQRQSITPNPLFKTPSTMTYNRRESTPLRTSQAAIRQPQFRQSVGTTTGDGGSLGIYSHSNSPLKKASSMYDIQGSQLNAPRNGLQAARRETIDERERSMSPAKKLRDTEKENQMRRMSGPLGFGQKQPGAGYSNDHHMSKGYY